MLIFSLDFSSILCASYEHKHLPHDYIRDFRIYKNFDDKENRILPCSKWEKSFRGYRVSAKFLTQNSPTFFYFSLTLNQHFINFFPDICPLKIRNFWNVSKFWYFFFNLLFLKRNFLLSLKIPWLFPDFSLNSLTFPWLFKG